MKTVLLTGGAGFIGRELAKRLLQNYDIKLRILDNLHRPGTLVQSVDQERVDFWVGDVRDPSMVNEATKGCHLIYHLAAQSTISDAELDTKYTFETNVAGTFNVLRSAYYNKVQRVVFTSSREVYGQPLKLPVSENAPVAPINYYGRTKLLGERICQYFKAAKSLDVRITRLSNVLGSDVSDRVVPRFFNLALNNKPLTVYGGDQIVDFIWIDDVANALCEIGMSKTFHTHALNVGSGSGTTITTLANKIGEICGKPFEIVLMPKRSQDVFGFIADISMMKCLLGWSPLPDPLINLSEVLKFYQSYSFPK
jgi:UDP-glucose 4-epimerase